jgi:signal peptidase II
MEDASTRNSAAHRSRPHVQLHPRDGLYLLLVLAVIGLDQLLKWVIRHSVERGEAWPGDWPVHIVHITNTGAAFGMFQNAGPLLVVTSLIGMAAILVYLFNPGFAHPAMRAGLALMFGGAVGNLIDRIYSGEVVDFIKFPHFPAFNVADSSITIGVLLLLWAMTREPTPPSENAS